MYGYYGGGYFGNRGGGFRDRGGRPRSANAMSSKERKLKARNERMKRKAEVTSLLCRTGGAIIRQKTDDSQTNSDSMDLYAKAYALTRSIPYMDVLTMSLVQICSKDIRTRVLDLLRNKYVEGSKVIFNNSVAAYYNFLQKNCLVCRGNRSRYDENLRAYIHKKCIRNSCVNTYYLTKEGEGYELRDSDFMHLPTFTFSGYSRRGTAYDYDVVWKKFHPVIDPNFCLESVMRSPARVAFKIANLASRAADSAFKEARSTVNCAKRYVAEARREEKQKAREERLKKRMGTMTRYLSAKKTKLMWKTCQELYVDR